MAFSDVAPGARAEIGLSLEGSHSKGAALHIIDHPVQEKIIDNKLIREYMLEHYERWHDYVSRVLMLDLDIERLWLVSGFSKTTNNWKATAFCSTSSEVRAAAGADVHGAASARLSFRPSSQLSRAFIGRFKPGPLKRLQRAFGLARGSGRLSRALQAAAFTIRLVIHF